MTRPFRNPYSQIPSHSSVIVMSAIRNPHSEIEDLEIRLLLEAIFERYGYDFRDYAPASLKRRICKCVQDEKLESVSGLQEKILHQPGALHYLLDTLSIGVTAMFRDPSFHVAFRRKIVPLLRQYPFVRIWHAGCATGEEVYSMAILLQEEGLYEKCRLYATDLNEASLKKAREGIFPLKVMQAYTNNYQQAGGTREFSKYYIAQYDHARFLPVLRKNVVWAQHNLVSDASFNEFHVILCRNVMIYFTRSLQTRVHNLLYESLALAGILGLGAKESLQFTPHEAAYEKVDEREKLYRKAK